MPTELPPDYKPQPLPPEGKPSTDPTTPSPPRDPDSPGVPGEKAPAGPDVASPVPGIVPNPTGLPTF